MERVWELNHGKLGHLAKQLLRVILCLKLCVLFLFLFYFKLMPFGDLTITAASINLRKVVQDKDMFVYITKIRKSLHIVRNTFTFEFFSYRFRLTSSISMNLLRFS